MITAVKVKIMVLCFIIPPMKIVNFLKEAFIPASLYRSPLGINHSCISRNI